MYTETIFYEPPTNREKRLSRDSRKTAAQNASQRLGAAFDFLGKSVATQKL